MNVAVASLVERLQIPHNYYWKKSQIKKNPKCVFASSSSVSVGSLVIETNQDQQQQISASTETPTTTLSSVAARRLILLRHAKSSWENRSIREEIILEKEHPPIAHELYHKVHSNEELNIFLLSKVHSNEELNIFLLNHDRPLSRTGQLDAIKVSQNLLKLGWIPQLILSSDALRTRETLKIMQEHVQAFLEAEVHFISSFYSVAAMDGQTAEHLRQAICKYSKDEILTVMCMGHNRGWEEAASVFSGVTVELKTCNAALLEATGKSWEEAFSLAGPGGWKLQGLLKPDTAV